MIPTTIHTIRKEWIGVFEVPSNRVNVLSHQTNSQAKVSAHQHSYQTAYHHYSMCTGCTLHHEYCLNTERVCIIGVPHMTAII